MRQSDGPFPVIGITGGVGAGKSAVLAHLRERGAFVIEADAVARELMGPGSGILREIADSFGEDVLLPDGSLDRAKLSDIVFSDRGKLKLLNSLTHPAVKREIKKRAEAARRERPVFVEAALLIEDHYEEICDRFWYVYAPDEVRRARLKASRGYSDEKISAILKNQLGDKEFRSHCAAVIDNGGARRETEEQIDRLFMRCLPDRVKGKKR